MISSFQSYLAESAFKQMSVPANVKKAMAPIFKELNTQDKSVSSQFRVVVMTPDREDTRKQIEQALQKAGISYERQQVAGSGFPGVFIPLRPKPLAFIFKPTRGGMNMTTLNSTITELAPALAFAFNKKFNDNISFYEFLKTVNHEKSNVYVNAKDKQAGKDFVEQFPTSPAFEDKMNNARAVLKYLHDLHKQEPIAQVIWGYRAKPAGIPSNHKGDMFVKFKTGKWLGVSLKAGGEKTKEPQLNTYVNPIFTNMGESVSKLDTAVNAVYKKINGVTTPDPLGRANKANTLKILDQLETSNPNQYDQLYDEMLDITRKHLLALLNKDVKNTINNFIYKQVLSKDPDVPLVVVKAYDTNYKFVTDEDALETFLPEVRKVIAKPSATSKQAFTIELHSTNKVITMNMTVRTNKSGVEHKLGQGWNLAVKFNGLS